MVEYNALADNGKVSPVNSDSNGLSESPGKTENNENTGKDPFQRSQELNQGVNFDSKGFESFLQSVDIDKWLDGKERQLWVQFGANRAQVEREMSMLQQSIDRALIQGACISAISQRREKMPDVHYQIEVYQDLTTVRPQYDRARDPKPPDRSEHIYQFTPRSRKRLMSRARRLNKENLPLPFFVTLTYHKNFQDCERSKRHLNKFLERWRKRSPEFQYFWKMEPQDRGAIHYHLAMFLTPRLQRLLRLKHWRFLKWHKNLKLTCLDALKVQIQNDWAEVTADVDGYDVPFTRFDYLRKNKVKQEVYRDETGRSRTVQTKCSCPRVEYKIEPDIDHRLYGTNVRVVENWKMFLGYIYKYMKKEVKKNPFGRPRVNAKITLAGSGYPRPPARCMMPGKLPVKRKSTGRFWGFSYGLDFEALNTALVDPGDLENVNKFANALNAFAFAGLTEHLINNAKRKKKELKDRPKLLQRHLDKYRAIFESQKKRFIMQRNALMRGYGLQFEIKSDVAMQCERYLKSKSVKEWFNFP